MNFGYSPHILGLLLGRYLIQRFFWTPFFAKRKLKKEKELAEKLQSE